MLTVFALYVSIARFWNLPLENGRALLTLAQVQKGADGECGQNGSSQRLVARTRHPTVYACNEPSSNRNESHQVLQLHLLLLSLCVRAITEICVDLSSVIV